MRKIDSVRRFPRLRRRRLVAPLAAVLLLLSVQVAAGAIFSPTRVINFPGFGDPQNSYAWAMQWFDGKLYVGTGRNVLCLENATLQFYQLGIYTTNPAPGVTCPADPYDLDLRAEIWQYTPETGDWLRVYQSPEIDNPVAPGKKVARDIAYRGMVVYHDALYVAGVTADEYIPELTGIYDRSGNVLSAGPNANPPRILRTTDGTTFTPLNGDPGFVNEVPGNSPIPMGFRSMKVFQDKLFVTASVGLRGDGVIMEVDNPDSDNPTFTQVSPPGTMGVFEIEVFNGQLYAGVGDLDNGYSVWRTDGTGPAPFQFTPIVTGGAGRGQDISSVVSMHVFQNRLYVGASGWFSTALPASELIRIAPDDSWELVVGNPRDTADGDKSPISNLPDGFGNIFNAHFWRMEDHDGALYVGTNDWSWQLEAFPPLAQWFQFQFGFDLYMSCDGVNWFPLTISAFHTYPENFGARTIESNSINEFLGTANQVQGTEVLKVGSWFSCRGSRLFGNPTAIFNSLTTQSEATTSANSADAILPPQNLQADVQASGTRLTWEPSPDADHYEVLRSVTGTAEGQGITSGLRQVLSKLPDDLPLLPQNVVNASLISNENQPEPYTSIGTTEQTVFVDTTAKPGVHYSYEVVAQTADGQESLPSNIVIVPEPTEKATFGQVAATISDLGDSGGLDRVHEARLTFLLNSAKAASDQSSPAKAHALLNALRNEIQSGSGIDHADVQELETMIRSLQRTILAENAPGG